MAAEQLFHVDAPSCVDWLELGDSLAPAHDGEVFAAVLDGIEQISKVAGSVGGADLGHMIRLSDWEGWRQKPIRGTESVCAQSCRARKYRRLCVANTVLRPAAAPLVLLA